MKRIRMFFTCTTAALCGVILSCSLIISLPLLWSVRPFVVLSGSMEPVVPTGSLIYIDTKVDPTDLGVGDIIAFFVNDDTLVTHRIVEKKADTFTTKGDANSTADWQEVPYPAVLGKEIFAIPCLGYLLGWTKSIRFYIFLITYLLVDLLLQQLQ